MEIEHFFKDEYEIILFNYSNGQRWCVIAIRNNKHKLLGLFGTYDEAKENVENFRSLYEK